MEKALFIGRIGQDARPILANRPFISFSIAVHQRRDASTLWVDCILFTSSENMLSYLVKGRLCFVSGDIFFATYQDRQGIMRPRVSLTVDSIRFLDRNDISDDDNTAA